MYIARLTSTSHARAQFTRFITTKLRNFYQSPILRIWLSLLAHLSNCNIIQQFSIATEKLDEIFKCRVGWNFATANLVRLPNLTKCQILKDELDFSSSLSYLAILLVESQKGLKPILFEEICWERERTHIAMGLILFSNSYKVQYVHVNLAACGNESICCAFAISKL